MSIIKKIFTIVELLIVTSVMIILISMLLPALKKAKDSTNRIKCASNLKNIGTAFNMYISDNNDYYPKFAVWGSSADDERWHITLYKYLGNEDFLSNHKYPSVFICPSCVNPGFNDKTISYAYNRVIGAHDTYPYCKTSSIKCPSKKLLAADSGYNNGIAPSYNIYQCINSELYIGDRHNSGSNVLWCDGHVSWHFRSILVNWSIFHPEAETGFPF